MVIVAAIDPDEHATSVIDEALSLSMAFDDPVHVVHVMAESEANERRRATANQEGGPIDDIDEQNIAARAAEDVVGDRSDQLECVGLVGEPSTEIVEYAGDVDARYVVIGPRKKSPTGKAIFGSVAQQVLLNSPAPTVSVIDEQDA
ncbi:universal stress protein [Natrialbaceae archaeon AArc-T1-2]|uniref:universal stress protein n=1 Tax=Natrialbaceae archaeon AArc-T1-2 TaxID=3053904 RepID=UPI00255B1158|nr:universal stress protein [Natrialbaceae archaeon AArc-T1-2]WIV67023.1 universal stress protein [Natrialbaceae archaeon AArc-T1-2]